MKNDTKFWNMLSKGYDKQVKRYQDAYEQCIATTRKYAEPHHALLDFACGTGIVTTQIAPDVDRVLAIDISPQMIEAAQDKAESKALTNVDFRTTDIQTLDTAEHTFDLILAFNILHYLPDVNAALTRIHALLKPGGYFISATDCIRDNPTMATRIVTLLSRVGVLPKMRAYRAAELEAEIEAVRFNIISSRNVFSIPPNQLIVAQK